MIPKIIHYCWFGGKDMPEDYKNFISGWKTLHPDFKFILWDESNSPIEAAYLQNALSKGNYANLSNYVRLYALLKHGGIYLDVDFKLLKSLHPLLNKPCFLGIQSDPSEEEVQVNNAIMGATKGHSFVKACLDKLIDDFDGFEEANLSSPDLVTKLLLRKGLVGHDFQILDDIYIFPRDTFYPVPWNKAYELDRIDELNFENSYGVHIWGRSWYSIDTLLRKIDYLSNAIAVQNDLLSSVEYPSSLLKNSGEVKLSVPNESGSIERNEDLKDVTYIITAPKSKRHNVLFTIESLLKHSPSLKFIYAEQALESDIAEITDYNFEDSTEELNVTWLKLALNKESEYDKLWGWNCAIKACSTEFIVVADFELVPLASFLRESILNLQTKKKGISASFEDNELCEIFSVRNLESTNQLYLCKEDKEWFASPVFLQFTKGWWENSGGFFERDIPVQVKSEIVTKFLKSNKFNAIPFQGTFYYDRDCREEYNYLFETNPLSPQVKWILEEKIESFFRFNKKYNDLFGIGNLQRFRSKSVAGKIGEIKNIIASSSVYAEAASSYRNLVIAITTYQRVDYLHDFLMTYLSTRNQYYNWKIIIADDGSTDGTLSYISELQKILPELILISNNRSGVAHQTNTIIQRLQDSSFDCCFKCDDDVLFLKPGWDDAYLSAMSLSGQQHICHYSNEWKIAEEYEEDEALIANCDLVNVQGAFFTITPDIVNEVGFFDEVNFGLRGWAHIDYSTRCWRAGFAGANTVLDLKNSSEYIILNYDPIEYKSSLSSETIYQLVDHHNQEEKKKLIDDEHRVWLPFLESNVTYDKDYILKLYSSALTNQNKIINDLKNSIIHKDVEIREMESSLDMHQNVFADNQMLKFKVKQVQEELAKITTIESDLRTKYSDTVSKLDTVTRLNFELNNNIKQEIENVEVVKSWYHKEYEVLPLWFKRFGHIIKILKGKRTVFKSN